MDSLTKINVFWFRRDLRFHDNHGLYMALSSPYPVLPIFIFDKNILDELKSKTDKRVAFIHHSLFGLQEGLKKFGTSTYILHDTPVNAFKRIINMYSVSEVITNHDYEPYTISRDEEIKELLAQHNIEFRTCKDQVIFEKNDIVKKDLSPYTVFTPYSKAWKIEYHKQKNVKYASEDLTDHFVKTHPFPFPSLKELGFQEIQIQWPSREINTDVIRHYEETRNLPAVDGTSKLSLHLRFGTVSIRDLACSADHLNEVWLNELIWREFFMQILFHFPRVVSESFKIKYDAIPWRNNEAEFESWCKGKTGYPLVDAGMRELNETGFMHNRVRMVAASFLIKHLLIDWRWGEAYFAEKLLDYELSSNNGNWQWCAGCGCDAAPYFRIFNPTEQQKKFDPKFVYIKKWITDYQPGYLVPIVDHHDARKRVMEVYKKSISDA